MSNFRHVVVAVAVMSAIIANVATFSRAPAQIANRAGVVVRFSDGRVVKRCVTFVEPQISGYDLLRRAGFEAVVNVTANNVAVCKVDDLGCANATNCFCQCQSLGANCVYWQYYQQTGSAWTFAQMGAANTVVQNGSVDGWSWGPGTLATGGSQPPLIPFDEICVTLPTETPPPPVVVPPNVMTNTPEPTHVPATNTPEPTPAARPTEVAATQAPTTAPSPTPAPPTPAPAAATSTRQATQTAQPTPTNTPTQRPIAVAVAATTMTPPVTSTVAAPTATPTRALSPTDIRPTVTARPATTATPQEISVVIVAPTPANKPSASQAPSEASSANPSDAAGYLVFGGIAIALVAVLVVGRLRK